MNNKGWISLHRKLLSSPVFQNEKMLKVWIYCLLKATHVEYDTLVGLQEVHLDVGEFIFGRKQASIELQMNGSTLRVYMKQLEKMNNISINSNNKFSIVKVLNYKDYQDVDAEEITTKSQQNNNKITTKSQQNNTNNNINNINNIIRVPRSNFDYVISEWNNLDKNISNIQTIKNGTQRYKLLKARENEYGKDNIIKAIRNINNSNFLKGYQKAWKITFDWFIKPNNFIKVLEGNYNDNDSNGGTSNYTASGTSDREYQEYINNKLKQKLPIQQRRDE